MLFRTSALANHRVPVEAMESRICLAATDFSAFVLYNADNGQPVGPFENNTTINYAALPPNLSVRAYTAGPVGSVRFGVDANSNVQTENFAPYFIQGEDSSGKPNVWKPANGTHTMKVTSYTGSGATGTTDNPLD